MANVAQRSFAMGEVSPKLYARTDLARYQAALRTLRNAIVTKEGGVESRPGTIWKGSTKGNAAARLLPLVLAADQSYVLEMGAGYLRFWLEGVQVTHDGVIIAWVTATPYTVGIVRSNGGTNYYCTTAHTADAATQPGVGAAWQTVWHALEGTIVEVPTPYTADEIRAVQWVDSAKGQRYFTHPLHGIHELIRVDASTWTFQEITLEAADSTSAPANLTVVGDDGAEATFCRYQVTAVIDLLESAPSNIDGWNKLPGPISISNLTPLTISWDAVANATEYRLYRSMKGQPFTLRAVLDADTLTFEDTNASEQFSVGYTAPTDATALTDFTVAGGYPAACGMYQQRLVLAGQVDAPDVIYASRAGRFTNFFPRFPLTDDDALSWRQVSSRLNRIRFVLEVEGVLCLFSETSEGTARGDADGILRPGEVNPKILSRNGVAEYPAPVVVDKSAIYVQARGGIVRDLVGVGGQASMGTDLTANSAHLVKRHTIVEMAYQQTPHSVVWMVRDDGVLLSLTYQRETGVFAWAHHDTAGTFESVAVVEEGTEDALYAIVNRTINGATVRYLERFANRQAALADLVLMDAAKTVTPAAGQLTGLAHLEGEAVSVVGDSEVLASPNNADYAVLTVTGGEITAPGAQASFHVGLPFTVDIETLDIDGAGQSIKDRGIQISGLTAWIEESRHFWAGPKNPATDAGLEGLEQVIVRNAEGFALPANEVLTGTTEMILQSAWTPHGRIFIRQVDPSPLTLLALIPEGLIGGRS